MQSVLERHYPHITGRLVELWPRADDAQDYLDTLLFKESARAERHGFNDEVWLDLQLLNEVLRLEHPKKLGSLATDVWAEAADVTHTTS